MISPIELSTDRYPTDLLPYGIVSTPNRNQGRLNKRVATRIGESAIDLLALARSGTIDLPSHLFDRPTLNLLIDAGHATWADLRGQLLELKELPDESVIDIAAATMQQPVAIADYVDFYSSIEHATNLGRLFRPDAEPLLPNWRHLPIGYHGRSGTVYPSGTPIERPQGQRKPPDAASPTFGPSQRLDIELELGAVLAASTDGRRYDDPHRHLFGFALVNDWSARDIQAWEYQPLGPFLGKSFATSMASWITPFEALEPHWVPAPVQDPEPLDYLRVSPHRNLNLELTVEIRTASSVDFEPISCTNARTLYWTFAQQIAHLSSNGAIIRTGDLIASGTISGSEPGQEGSLIERTRGGSDALVLRSGETRTFLEDGDTIRISGRLGGAEGPSLAECVGTIYGCSPNRSD